jgi:hypothetical protein
LAKQGRSTWTDRGSFHRPPLPSGEMKCEQGHSQTCFICWKQPVDEVVMEINSCPLVSFGNCFQKSPQITKSADAQVYCIKWCIVSI